MKYIIISSFNKKTKMFGNPVITTGEGRCLDDFKKLLIAGNCFTKEEIKNISIMRIGSYIVDVDVPVIGEDPKELFKLSVINKEVQKNLKKYKTINKKVNKEEN